MAVYIVSWERTWNGQERGCVVMAPQDGFPSLDAVRARVATLYPRTDQFQHLTLGFPLRVQPEDVAHPNFEQWTGKHTLTIKSTHSTISS